jgi:hypothetical protein
MSPDTPFRLEDAREQERLLQEAIDGTTRLYPDADPRFLATYLASTVQELELVRARIDSALGIAHLRESQAAAWFSLSGGRVGHGTAPLSVVERTLDAVQTGVRQMAAFLETGHAAVRRVSAELNRMASLEVVAFAPGSLRIGVSPEVGQMDISRDESLSEVALVSFIAVASWAQDDESDQRLEEMLPDPVVRRQMLARIRELAPGENDAFEVVEISGPLAQRATGRTRTRLTRGAYRHATEYLARHDVVDVVFYGRVVAVDMERSEFKMRVEGRRVPCTGTEDVIRNAAVLMRKGASVEARGRGVFQVDRDWASRVHVLSLDEAMKE